MTPTEQDKELLEDIADIFDELCEPTNKFWHRDSGLHWAGKVMRLITKYGDKRELDGRMDELKKIEIGGDNIWTVDSGTDTAMLIKERIAELKAQQQEV